MQVELPLQPFQHAISGTHSGSATQLFISVTHWLKRQVWQALSVVGVARAARPALPAAQLSSRYAAEIPSLWAVRQVWRQVELPAAQAPTHWSSWSQARFP